MSIDNTPRDEFAELIHSGGADQLATAEFQEQAIHAEHNQSLEVLRNAIAAFTKKPSNQSLQVIMEALTACDNTFKNKMRWLLADDNDLENCMELITQEIADDEMWRSAVIKSLVAESTILPAAPEFISGKLHEIISEHDIDNKNDLVEGSGALYMGMTIEDINTMSPIAQNQYDKRQQRKQAVGRGALDVIKIAAGAAIAILATKKFGRNR